jgi:hypothetical protein
MNVKVDVVAKMYAVPKPIVRLNALATQIVNPDAVVILNVSKILFVMATKITVIFVITIPNV